MSLKLEYKYLKVPTVVLLKFYPRPLWILAWRNAI